MDPDAALAACRFVHDGAAMLLWGAFAYLAVLVPRGLAGEVQGRLARFRCGAVILAALTTAATFPLDVAAIGNGWSDVLDPATVEAVLVETSTGTAWQVQAVLALLLTATLLVPPRSRLLATAIASGLLLAALATTGHAAMQEGLLGAVHRLNDAVHVLAAGAWLGALVPLLPILTALEQPLRRHEAGVALRRFSAAGHGAVALVLLTGVINTGLVLKRWPTDWSSPYQSFLAAKIGLVTAMTALALANRYGLVPRMASDRSGSLTLLREATVVELALGLMAIACVSVFGLLDPA